MFVDMLGSTYWHGPDFILRQHGLDGYEIFSDNVAPVGWK